MIARQKIQAGLIHAGKTATVSCENNHFQVVIDGQTAAMVPCTTTYEIHQYEANATHRASHLRDKVAVTPCPERPSMPPTRPNC